MNGNGMIIKISKVSDIANITEKTKYINLIIDNDIGDAIHYFRQYGQNFSYADMVGDRSGFIYADYDIFNKGEEVVTNILKRMPEEGSTLEKIRYLYLELGKVMNMDINAMEDKNEMVSFGTISTINNIWSALANHKGNDISICKIFMYLCSQVGIKCELVSGSIRGNIVNKVYIDDSFLLVDLANDMANIQAGMQTKFFDKYNDDKEMDIKLGYIKEEYLDDKIDKALANINYTSEDVLERILSLTEKLINVNKMGTVELGKVYQMIFDKYAPNYDIKVNNLFVCSNLNGQEHFIVFSYGNNLYSYNYNKGYFVAIDAKMLYGKMKECKIGLYDDEDFRLMKEGIIL